MTRPPPQNDMMQLQTHFAKGAADFLANQYDSARRSFEDARKLAPKSAELERYLRACDLEAQALSAIDAGKRALGTRSYGKALEEFQKVDKGSVQFDEAQGQAQDARREAVNTAITEARNLAMTNKGEAESKINEGLRYDSSNPELLSLRDSLR